MVSTIYVRRLTLDILQVIFFGNESWKLMCVNKAYPNKAFLFLILRQKRRLRNTSLASSVHKTHVKKCQMELWRDKKIISLYTLCKEYNLLSTQLQTFGLRNCEKTNLVCVKLPGDVIYYNSKKIIHILVLESKMLL